MLYNKNNVRKTNDKKILHKVGKQWKVISVALLMAIGGGAAVATHANAQSNDNINENTNAEVNALEQKPAVQSAQSVAPKSASVSSASAKSVAPSSVSYLNTYGGSAASYRAKAINDNAEYNANNAKVQKYVNSLNAEYPTQTNSLQASYNSASDKTSADQSSANYFSGIAAQPNYASTVESLAAKANMTSSAYIESVGASASNYNAQLSYGKSAVSEMNVVNSYAQVISAINANPVLSTEYSDKAVEASDKADIASAYNANAQVYYSNVASNSAANDSALTSNKASLAKTSTEEQIALINSGLDGSFVQSMANKVANSNYANSQSVSAQVSAMARSVVNNNNYAVQDWSLDNDVTLDKAKSDAKNLPNSYVTSSSANDGKYNVYFRVVESNGARQGLTASSAVNGTTNYNYDFAAGDSADLVRDVSDTAAQFEYSEVNVSLTNAIKGEQAAKASYSAAVSSASVAAQSANNAYSSAESVADADAVLGNNPTLQDIFNYSFDNGTKTPTSMAANSYAASVDATSGTSEIASINNSIQNASGLQDAAKAAITAMGNTHGATAKSVKKHLTNDVQTALEGIVKTIHNSQSDTLSNINLSNEESNNKGVEAMFNTLKQYNGSVKGSAFISALGASFSGSTLTDGSTLNDIVTDISNAANDSNIHINGSEPNYTTVKGILDSTKYSAAYNQLKNTSAKSDDNGNMVATSAALNSASSDDENVSLGASAIASLANSNGTSYKNVSNASASYSAATDEDVALAGSYANSYSALLSADSAAQSAAKNSLDTFYVNHADAEFASALSTTESAAAAEPNDHALAIANGKHVFNYAPKYVTVLKSGLVHSSIDYGKNGDRKLTKVPAGTKLTVKGVGIAQNGVVRYQVSYNGANGYFTNNDGYVKPTYLVSGDNADLTTLKPVRVYNSTDFTNKNYVETVPAGQNLTKMDVISMDNVYGGYTRVETPSGDFFTANTNYVGYTNEDANGNASANGNGVHFWA